MSNRGSTQEKVGRQGDPAGRLDLDRFGSAERLLALHPAGARGREGEPTVGAGADAGAADPRRGSDHAAQPRILRQQLAVTDRPRLCAWRPLHGHQVVLTARP